MNLIKILAMLRKSLQITGSIIFTSFCLVGISKYNPLSFSRPCFLIGAVTISDIATPRRNSYPQAGLKSATHVMFFPKLRGACFWNRLILAYDIDFSSSRGLKCQIVQSCLYSICKNSKVSFLNASCWFKKIK